jgi:VWFA-related protein
MSRILNSQVVLVSALALGSWLSTQKIRAQENQTHDLKVPVDLVVVPVTVEDKEGKLVFGLGQGNFEIFEDGVAQKLSYFSVEPSPLSVAFLIDRTIDARAQGVFRQNMLSLVEAFSSFDEMALYEFLESAEKIQDFTNNKEALLKPIAKIGFVPARITVSTTLAYAPKLNTTFLDNAILTAAHDLQRRARNRRKVIFVVSNGIASPAERRAYPDTKKVLLKNGIVVYGIGQGNSFLFRKVDPLKKYTEPTGGEVLYPWKTRAFCEAYQRVSQAARNQYVLGYVPLGLSAEETYRTITVRVIQKDFDGNVRHRKGYYASLDP